MKSYSLFLGMLMAVLVIAALLLTVGVRPHGGPQGAALYNRQSEVLVNGRVSEVQEFACPVNEGELGGHLMLQTSEGTYQVHLIPSRVMRSQGLKFATGEQIQVTGSKTRLMGKTALIAREIVRGDETFTLRDSDGHVMMMQ